MVISKPKTPFLFLFTGDEFLRRSRIESLLNQLLSPELRATNLIRIYPDDLDWPNVFSQASTLNLMGSAQVFWISEVNRIKKGDWSAFESYCQHPTTGSFFIFEAEELPASHALAALVKRFGIHTHFKSEGGAGGFEALRQKLKRAGKSITPGGWQLLEERLSGSLWFMDLALDRLILYAETSAIDERAVERISGEFIRFDTFELAEALAEKNAPRALEIFHHLHDLSGDIQSVIGLIHWQLKRIWQAQALLAQGTSREEVGRKLRIPPFRLGSFLSQVKRFERASVEELIRKLWKLDWEAKTGAVNEAVALETFLAGVQ